MAAMHATAPLCQAISWRRSGRAVSTTPIPHRPPAISNMMAIVPGLRVPFAVITNAACVRRLPTNSAPSQQAPVPAARLTFDH